MPRGSPTPKRDGACEIFVQDKYSVETEQKHREGTAHDPDMPGLLEVQVCGFRFCALPGAGVASVRVRAV